MKKYILCESRLDFKYKMIFSKLDKDFVIIEGGFIKLMKVLIRKKSFYHIRYVKYRGSIITFLKLLIIFIFCKFSQSKIIWTCHNIYEHNFKSKVYNDFIRNFIALISDYIFVFHKDLINYLPIFSKNKISVATFGNYKEFIEDQTLINQDFQNSYTKWLNLKKIPSPDLITISAAKNNKLSFFIENIDKSLNFTIIAPYVYFDETSISDNIFIFNRSFVKSEVKSILNNHNEIIGVIAHDNLSVPTSIYMFASFRIPVIVLDINPLNSLVKDFGIGEVVESKNDVNLSVMKIRKNYKLYQFKCTEFIRINSWDNSIDIHKSVFK